MSLIICPECCRDVSDKATACPHCGFPIKQETEIKRHEYSVPQEQPEWPEQTTQPVATPPITSTPQPLPTYEEAQPFYKETSWGVINTAITCPHCHQKGGVRTKMVDRKKGISGAKATGAILTGGLSLFATGLSRKEEMTQAHCNKCNSTWDY